MTKPVESGDGGKVASTAADANREEPIRTPEGIGTGRLVHLLNREPHFAKFLVADNMNESDHHHHHDMEDLEIPAEEFLRSLDGQSSSSDKLSDKLDALGINCGPKSSRARSPNPAVARMPVAKDAEVYNMGHRRRGVALILNHKTFHPSLGLNTRNGTDRDCENLKSTLSELGFEVKIFHDLQFYEIRRLLEKTSAEDHSDADCLLVAVLSHGELGVLYASDTVYKSDNLWFNFNAEHCPTLAGKPKLFFIQACQGDQLDGGVSLRNVSNTSTDSSECYTIPTHADFLIACSTIPGYYSWRNTTAGSWFIQSLCCVLKKHGYTDDLMSNLTRVSRMVALDFQSSTPGNFAFHEKKQIPCITSMLTRKILFTPQKPSLLSPKDC